MGRLAYCSTERGVAAMGYEKILKPQGLLYHYTKRRNLESILREGRIRRFYDRESWFCTSIDNTLQVMEMTVMREGSPYVDVGGILRHYPAFCADDYVILELKPRIQNGDWVIWNQELPDYVPESLRRACEEFSRLKVGFRGDLKFYFNPQVFEVAELLIEQRQESGMKLQ